MERISFEVTIIIPALELLRNNFEVREEAKVYVTTSDYYYEEIRSNMEDQGVIKEYIDLFDCADGNTLFEKYISVNEEGVTFDYSEAGEANDRADCYFRVPCSFDLEKYIKVMDQGLADDRDEPDKKIMIAVFRDTVCPELCGDDNLTEIEVDRTILKGYFTEFILPSFKGDDKTVSDEGLFEEWLNECTADSTTGLYDYMIKHMDKAYYEDVYIRGFNRLYEKAKKEGMVAPEVTADEEFSEYATPEEVAGMYIHIHDTAAYKVWMDNLDFYKQTGRNDRDKWASHDEKVTEILARLYPESVKEKEEAAKKKPAFKDGKEMISYLYGSGDLYSPKTEQYVFSYNEEGDIAVYDNISISKAHELSSDMKEGDETGWQAFLGAGGYIYSVSDEGAQIFCDQNFDCGWIRADENTFADGVPSTEESLRKYIIGISGSEMNDVVVQTAYGTEDQIKKYLLSLVLEDKEEDEDNWDSGAESTDDIKRDENGRFYAYGCYRSYHMDYSATAVEEVYHVDLTKDNG